MTDPRVDIVFSEIKNTSSDEAVADLVSTYAEFIVASSPFATEEFSENNYVPREW